MKAPDWVCADLRQLGLVGQPGGMSQAPSRPKIGRGENSPVRGLVPRKTKIECLAGGRFAGFHLGSNQLTVGVYIRHFRAHSAHNEATFMRKSPGAVDEVLSKKI